MNRGWWFAAVALAACGGAALWPMTTALPSRDVLAARLASAVVAAIACALLNISRRVQPTALVAISLAAAMTGAGLLLAHFDAGAACIADYAGRPVIIGRVYAPDVALYINENPGLSASDRLLDAGGIAERVWTGGSIRSCRVLVGWAGVGAIPFFAVSAGALIARARQRFVSPAQRPAPTLTSLRTGAPQYDAFLSYRHTEPDLTYARDVLERLESDGFRVAIDFRDFAANEHFLREMERCIKESRFVLCVITAQYLASDHTGEEAIMSKTLDMAERRRHLVPLLFDQVELPVWLHGLVGINFTGSANVEPFERLVDLLSAAARKPTRS